MYIFLLSVIPLFAACVIAWSGPRFSYKKDIFHLFFGILAGVFYSAAGAAFVRAYRLAPYSFSIEWIYFLLTRTVFPLFFLFIVFVVLSKGTFRERLYSLPLYCTGFYLVFLPYQTIHSFDSFDFFLLFIFPLITVCMLSLIWYACTIFSQGRGVVYGIAVLSLAAAVFVPSILFTLYFLHMMIWLRISLGILFAILAGYAGILSFPHKV